MMFKCIFYKYFLISNKFLYFELKLLKNKMINNFSNLNEDEKICDGKHNNNVCESVEIKLK